ncbi:zinc metalloprotease HtpX [bacterium CG2_30_37_16]|nr:MAG: zinc metalloprotease HtpX [bacterium CG2_30_37_16]PIP30460.1 MAG: zinc metalloprotease HtpX [bacterium (Candidatus Howlettbacteria) CG23_combo_of_CG06-09_8_20_14_all_37_9]PIX98708.1 MAG: zinc metalloprotease HtpX [bacterium (Candidatus Howlettbacteria) CG_4_10_14_3_um_filter_37_10]PJB06702.1 MAG: zinc metalloprotease HtpX [bacterium (Candidatus Howlettbacteria) CG_4_9_14_3_um_filter_37_10]
MYKEIEANKAKSWLILILFPILVIGTGYFFSRFYPIIFPIAIVLAVSQGWVGYFFSDKIALATSGARPADGPEFNELNHIVENIAITAGQPKPRVYIIDDSAPNAFATGRDPKHAAIAVTTGLLTKLEKVELEGVIAHEMSHVRNYDIKLASLMVVMVGIVALLGDLFLRFSFWDNDDSDNKVGVFLKIIGIVLALLAPLFATLIQLAMSRKREYLADASGALLTRYPEGLARALEKILADTEPLEVANKATAHLYIANPLKDHKGVRGWFSGLFDTHPPAEERIKKLRSMV